MKLVALSDTHNQHDKIIVPYGDVLIHAGDATGRGSVLEIERFIEWFSSQPHKHKILIAGNHDFGFESHMNTFTKGLLKASGITYLEDSGTEIDGVKFWGSPYTPIFFNWAFMQSEAELEQTWEKIPLDTNVLITHGPPYGILDKVKMTGSINKGERVGCKFLRMKVDQLNDLRYHFFGHIHEEYGNLGKHYNVSVLDERYSLVNEPVVLEIK